MRYCPVCDEEYRDDVPRCTDDDTPLVDRATWEAGLARQGRTPLEVKKLATVAVLEDRFEADEVAQNLADEGFHVSISPSKAPTVGPLTNPTPTAWAIVVPEGEKARAEALVTEWRAALESSHAQAEQAAETEEAAGESPPKG